LVGLHIDHVHEVVQRTQTGLAGDIVDEEERIGFQIGRRPKTSIFFLTGSVGDG
jgi:RNase P/RNase MRP subunit p29